MDEIKKKVDESWKDRAEKEKEAPAPADAGAPQPGPDEAAEPADFTFFITSLALQASIALGAMPHPASNKIEENPAHAKLLIDTLGMLKEKTQGNLNAEEDSLLENFLYELRMQYVAKTQGGAK